MTQHHFLPAPRLLKVKADLERSKAALCGSVWLFERRDCGNKWRRFKVDSKFSKSTPKKGSQTKGYFISRTGTPLESRPKLPVTRGKTQVTLTAPVPACCDCASANRRNHIWKTHLLPPVIKKGYLGSDVGRNYFSPLARSIANPI